MARLPYRKSLDEFDFSFQPSLDARFIRELATMAFVQWNENLIFLEPPGVGKTHLAVAMAIEAVAKGLSVYFVNLTHLIDNLRKPMKKTVEHRLRVYIRPRILVIDEVGYLPLDSLAANLFFQVVSARYERGSILLTSHKSFEECGELLGDPILATAVLDRLLHHSHDINIRGHSYRLREKMTIGVYGGSSESQ